MPPANASQDRLAASIAFREAPRQAELHPRMADPLRSHRAHFAVHKFVPLAFRLLHRPGDEFVRGHS
jgi:hypothetical protein